MFSYRRLAVTILLAGVVGGCASASSTPVASGSGSGATSAASHGGNAGATGGPVAQGGDLCALLGPGDFAAVGVSGAGVPTKNSDAPTDAYCVYAGLSSATGGIEFDIFIGDPDAAYQEIKANGGILLDDATGDLPGVDAAGTALNGPGGMVSIGVKKGQLTFDIGFPSSEGGRPELLALARLVLERSNALA